MKVTAENTTFELLERGASFPPSCTFETTHGAIPSLLAREREPYLPCIFPSTLPNHLPVASYLLWPTVELADEALTAVRERRYRDEHFYPSIRAHFAPKFCFDCGRTFPTLSVDSASPYLGAPSLMHEKLQRWHTLRCPQCGGFFRQLVVKILEVPDKSLETQALLGQ